MGKKQIDNVVTGITTDDTQKDKIIGIVADCGYLRVRDNTSLDANEISSIPAGTIMELYDTETIDGFYAVRTIEEDGNIIEGYCLADFIKLQDSSEKE